MDILSKFQNILTNVGVRDINLKELTNPDTLKNKLDGLTPGKLIELAKTIKSEFKPSQNQQPVESEIQTVNATIQGYEASKTDYDAKNTIPTATAVPTATDQPSQIDNMKGQLISGIKDFYSEMKNSNMAGHVDKVAGNVAQLSDKALGIVDRIDRTTMAFTGLFEVIGNTYKAAIEIGDFGKTAAIESGKFGFDAGLQAGKLGLGAALAAGQNASNIGQELLKTVGNHTNIIVDGLLSIITLPLTSTKLLLSPAVSGNSDLKTTKESLTNQANLLFKSYTDLSKIFLHSYAAILGCDPNKWSINFLKKNCDNAQLLLFNQFESKIQTYTAEINKSVILLNGQINRLTEPDQVDHIVKKMNEYEESLTTKTKEIQQIIETKVNTPAGGMKRLRTQKRYQKSLRKTRQHKRKTRHRRRKNTLRR